MTTHSLHTQHERSFESNRFVYPVLSRRSGGLSIGVNLNPDKVCNFDCIYCQVDRRSESETRFVEIDGLLAELGEMLSLVSSGEIWQTPKFSTTPSELRKLCDVAFSGDGEPTTYKNFDEIIQACSEAISSSVPNTKMVLITNASMFHRPHVKKGLAIFDKHGGEIWAKLDAGTAEYFKTIDRTKIAFSQVLENITQAATLRPVVIQSLFMRVHDEPPSPEELKAYCERLNEFTTTGGKLKLVQVYTIARQTTENYATPLADEEVDAIVELVQTRTGLPTAAFYGVK